MNESANSFAFVKMGGFSGVNDHLLGELRRQLPALDVDVIDIGDLKAINRWDAVRLVSAVAHDYGLSSCLKKSSIDSRIMRTAYCFRKVREYLLRRLSQKKYVFTLLQEACFFQPSSLFT